MFSLFMNEIYRTVIFVVIIARQSDTILTFSRKWDDKRFTVVHFLSGRVRLGSRF